jgi:hypothetical protein
MPSLAIQPATVPGDAPYSQGLMNFIASYLRIAGLENLTGVLIQTTAPGATDRDKLWLKTDLATNRALGLFVYRGDWVQVPAIVPNGDQEPIAPKSGELFFNTTINTLKLYNGTQWTTNFFHTGDTASRPADVPVNYLYFDTEIARVLRYTADGWTTLEGVVGDVKMVNFASVEAAKAANPGWVEFTEMGGRFLVGAGEDYAPQAESEGVPLRWSAKGLSAQGGSREANASFINSLTLNGTTVAADRKMDGPTDLGNGVINFLPPSKALIFLRKDF